MGIWFLSKNNLIPQEENGRQILHEPHLDHILDALSYRAPFFKIPKEFSFFFEPFLGEQRPMDEEGLTLKLLDGVAKKNEKEFAQLYMITQKRVFHYLFRLTKSYETAEDLLMETYTEVWKSAKKFRSDSKVLTWMIGIARNLAMNEIRKNKKLESELAEDLGYPSEQLSHSERTEKLQILQEALNRLSFEHRETLDLVFLQGMGYEDIAQIIHIPVNTVKTRVFYAKEKLRTIITRMGIEKDDLL